MNIKIIVIRVKKVEIKKNFSNNIFNPINIKINDNEYVIIGKFFIKFAVNKYIDLKPRTAKKFEERIINKSLVIEKIAGMLSIENIISLNSIRIKDIKRGVINIFFCIFKKKDSLLIFSVTLNVL